MPGASIDLNRTELKRFARAAQNSGLFTHFYAAAGDLSSSEQITEIVFGEVSRDVFDLASLTKALFTTPAILLKTEQLGIDLDQPLALAAGKLPKPTHVDLLPALLQFSIKSLLRHESGLPAWRNFYVCAEDAPGRFARRDARTVMETVLREPLVPGQRYSDVGFIALGMILEFLYQSSMIDIYRNMWRADGALSTACQQLNFASAWNELELRRRAIPTGYCPVRRRDLVGEVYDENAWAMGGVAAHAGLFGSGRALTDYLRTMHHDSQGRWVLNRQADEIICGNNAALLGWRQGADYSSMPFGDGQSMGHLGFTGTAMWVTSPTHPTKPNRFGVLLTNRTVHGRLNPEIKEFRHKCFELLWKLV